MPVVPLTRSSHLVPFAKLLERAGERVAPLLEKARLPCDCLATPDSLVPSMAGWRFRDLVAKETSHASVAYDATERLEISDLGKFGAALLQAPTLHTALREFCRLCRTQTSTVVVKVSVLTNGDVLFGHRFLIGTEAGQWHSNLYVLQWMIKLVRLVQPSWSPSHVWSSSAPGQESIRVIELLFGASSRFAHAYTGFVIPAAMISLPITRIAGPNGSSHGDEDRLWTTAPAATFADSLQQILVTYSNDRWLSVHEASDVIGTSDRTMQRRLAGEGTTFHASLDRARFEVARSLLIRSDESLIGMSKHLGYATQGNFSRAFVRWAGVPPSEFRRQHHQCS